MSPTIKPFFNALATSAYFMGPTQTPPLILLLLIASSCSSPQTPQDAGVDADEFSQDAHSEDADSEDADIESFNDADITDDGDIDADVHLDADVDDVTLPAFNTCLGRVFDPEFSGDWRHPLSSGARSLGQPGHSLTDIIVTMPVTESELEGKFAYGILSLDLEDELITGFIDNCTEWLSMGEALTDSDGRVRLAVPPEILLEPGRYEVVLVVQGDGTLARGTLLVVPPASNFVVFDIDGTLTTSDSELVAEFFSDLFGGDRVPEPWPDAHEVVSRYEDAGYLIIYLTGRPYWLDDITREWLADLEFTTGTLHLTRDLSESMSTDEGVGAYKRDYLLGVLDAHHIVSAYGNATTDIYGYQNAGIANESIFIIGEHAGADGTQVVTSYPDHLEERELSEALQPFSW